MVSLTKRSIMESCIRLLEQRPVNKISVKDIVEDCGINRNTFYYHFADLPALVEAIVQAEADRIMQSYHGVSSLEECVAAAMSFATEHRQTIFHIYNSANREILERSLLETCEYVSRAFVGNIAQGYRVGDDDREAVVQAYKCELFGQIINWLGHGMNEELERRFLRVCALRDGMAEEVFRRCDAGQ